MSDYFKYPARAYGRPRIDWRGVNYRRVMQNLFCMAAGAGIYRALEILLSR